VISAAENSNKFHKIRFWKETSVEDVVTLGPTAQPTLVYLLWKVVVFVLFVMLRFAKPQSPQCTFHTLGKP
jgi:hypothetical protein